VADSKSPQTTGANEMASTREISQMIVAAKNSASIRNVPSQFIHILDGLNDLVTDLEQRVTKLEGGNILDDPDVQKNSNILNK
jgi:hypothetical protein